MANPVGRNHCNVADYDQLEAKLGYRFRDPQLLKLALTHPSIAHEIGHKIETNQRLEFLGDAVLQLVLTSELFTRFPEYEEGPLTKTRARMVNRRALADHGREIGLGSHLLVSRGEELHGGRDRQSALADAYEAVLGAVFLDGGFEAAREVVLEQFKKWLGSGAATTVVDNPKGELQEFLQANSSESPQYHVVSATGPDHDRVFECTVHHGGMELARGSGRSKKAAESEAARHALEKCREGLPHAPCGDENPQ
ncbi:MAG TPA: ribonuclease III [Verrucomicrobiae bacterium]|nr:ribonuclease III [Verrucomicrobiae bacterium]